MQTLAIFNKSDLPRHWDASGLLAVSAVTGDGLGELTAEILTRLVPHRPAPGDAVPYTPALAVAVDTAAASLAAGNPGEARETLARLARPG